MTTRIILAVTADLRCSAQARSSWQTQDPVPVSNTPAPLAAVYQVASAKLGRPGR